MSHWSLGLSRAELERDQQAREDHRGLLSHEMFWRDHQVWLAEQGYMLRPRYRPGWTPSWEGEERAWTEHEDGMVAAVGDLNCDTNPCISCIVAPFRYRCNSSVGWRDCYPQESFAHKGST